jgi:hypothetical protein
VREAVTIIFGLGFRIVSEAEGRVNRAETVTGSVGELVILVGVERGSPRLPEIKLNRQLTSKNRPVST